MTADGDEAGAGQRQVRCRRSAWRLVAAVDQRRLDDLASGRRRRSFSGIQAQSGTTRAVCRIASAMRLSVQPKARIERELPARRSIAAGMIWVKSRQQAEEAERPRQRRLRQRVGGGDDEDERDDDGDGRDEGRE